MIKTSLLGLYEERGLVETDCCSLKPNLHVRFLIRLKMCEGRKIGPIYENLWQCYRIFESGLYLPRAKPTTTTTTKESSL